MRTQKHSLAQIHVGLFSCANISVLELVGSVTRDASIWDAPALAAATLFVVINVRPHAVTHVHHARGNVKPDASTASARKNVENYASPAPNPAIGDAVTISAPSCAVNLATVQYAMNLVKKS